MTPAELRALEDVLLNTSRKVPLHDRFRALFTLKSLKNDDAVAIISKGVVCLCCIPSLGPNIAIDSL